jgi:manganese/iron transport system permease protein
VLLDQIAEPWQFDLVARAFGAAILIGVLGGALGVFVVVKGLAFTGEAFAHAALPGAVVATMIGASIPALGLVSGLLAAGVVALVSRSPRVSVDAAVGAVFIGALALGALIYASQARPAVSLDSLLFGSILGVSATDLALTGAAVVIGLGAIAALWRPLVATAFDAPFAAATGVRTGLVDAALLALVALGVVVGVQAIGTLLVLALIVTPAATARLLARRFLPTVALAAVLGAAEGVTGLYVSYYADVAAGGAVVLVATGVFLLALAASPRSFVVGRLRRRAASPADAA